MMRRRKDETGAYAIMFAVLAIVMFGFAALAVDLGNVMARKSDVQGQADFAALGAALKLGPETSGEVPDEVLTEARLLLNQNRARNWPADDCDTGPMCIEDNAQLEDEDLANGEVRFTDDGLQVITPLEQVDYGFIQGLPGRNDDDETQVQGRATVGLFSPAGAILPVYAVEGCDFGPQDVTRPPPGHETPVTVPTLALNGETNATTNLALSENYTDPNPSPDPVITVSGKDFKDTDMVGFFPESGGGPSTVLVSPAYTKNGAGGSVTITVPDSVTAADSIWYVRVHQGGSVNKWSASGTAAPRYQVGDAVLQCDDLTAGGNFGTLRIDRGGGGTGEDLEQNFAEGLEDGIGLAIAGHVEPNGECEHGEFDAVESGLPNPGLNEGTNCVMTDPGVAAEAATKGLLTGGSDFDGRLVDKPTATGCSPDADSDERPVDVGNGANARTLLINDDVLSCFLTSGTLASVADPDYSGGVVFDKAIYDSPRFFWVPVLAAKPTTGGHEFSIIDIRPAFLTDETLLGAKGSPTASLPNNGLQIDDGSVEKMTVFFFHIDTLPPQTDGGVVSYMGVGPKILRLID